MASFRALALGVWALLRLGAYEPQRVTLASLWRWLRQFPGKNRPALIRLLHNVRFVSKQETTKALLAANDAILSRLAPEGIGIDHLVYVTLDSAGSSSGVMLEILRNRANLERRGAHLIDSKNVTELQKRTLAGTCQRE